MTLNECPIKRRRYNPIELLKDAGLDYQHVTFDPKLTLGDYSIRMGQSHDGTCAFTHQMFYIAIERLALRRTYFKKDDPVDWPNVKEILYRVGWMRYCAVYKIVDLPIGNYPGMQERIRIPIIAKLIL